jgi:hypothetical protein
MTSIAIWSGADQRGPASLRIAADSRISWGESATWDHGRKTFASAQTPDIFGYCGDVLFVSLLLSHFVSALDSGAFRYSTGRARFGALRELAKTTWASYPSAPLSGPFSLVHGTRDGEGISASFLVNVLHCSSGQGWIEESIRPPEESSKLILSLGSGRDAIAAAASMWEKSTAAGTSRAVYSSFVRSIQSRRDPASGGSPQLVSLIRIGNGQTNGIIFEGGRYLGGIPIGEGDLGDDITWFNEFFERCDATTMTRKPGAQIHEKHPLM